jgi:hypothetical protein
MKSGGGDPLMVCRSYFNLRCLLLMRNLLILFLFVFDLALAAPSDSTRNKQDTTYIIHYEDKLIAKLDLDNDYISFKLMGDGFKYDIRPNQGPSRTLSVSYKWAYVAVSFLPDFIVGNKQNERKGETAGFGLGTGFTAPRLIADAKYLKVKGFYLHNTSDYVPNWNPDQDPYIQFPDLNMQMFRASAYYKTNPNFSVRAIQYQTEAQRKSASSFLPGVFCQYYVIDNKSSSATSQKSNNLVALAQLNHYATLVVHKNVYATLGVGGAGGFYYTWLLTRQPTGDIETTQSSGVLRGYLHAGLGYNGNRFVAGAEVLYYKTFSKQTSNVEMVFTRSAFQIFIGYRFNAPNFIVKSLNFIG